MEDGKGGEEIGGNQNQQQGTMNSGMEHQQMEGPVLASVERLDEVG